MSFCLATIGISVAGAILSLGLFGLRGLAIVGPAVGPEAVAQEIRELPVNPVRVYLPRAFFPVGYALPDNVNVRSYESV